MRGLLEDKLWKTGSGQEIFFSDAASIIRESVFGGSKIFIGSDSSVNNRKIHFATTLCLYGGKKSSRYFFYKEMKKKKEFKALVARIIEETRRTIELAEFIIHSYNFQRQDIEIHLDISPPHLNNGTSKYSEMLKGYVNGHGLKCKLKPNAWASQTVADKHSK